VRDQIETVAEVDSTVLLLGESGTGKELVARAIHRRSPRRFQPMVIVHCGALTETLMESELFGHEKGAFTGAQYRKKGKFEAASGGSIFLDEIGDISLKTQTDLLRVLQEREIVRVGGNQPIKVDFRVIAATNRDLPEMVREGLFRADLYYRLNVFTIHMPSLRDRTGDIALLATFFLEKYSRQMNRKFSGFDRAALDKLNGYHWPGNVRELENMIERAVVVGREPVVKMADIALTPEAPEAEDMSIEAMERKHIEKVLADLNWNQTRAARALGIDRVTLYHKVRRYGFLKAGRA
jgi:transcriptional regulator with GAF, ATPase, and Fis domain